MVPLKQFPLLFGASSSMAYDPASVTDLASGKVTAHKGGMSSLSGVGVVASGTAAAAVFRGDWGVGGAPAK